LPFHETIIKMIKTFIQFISLLLILPFNIFAQDNEILVNIPKEVKAGNEFLLTISMPANCMEGASRLQLQLPNGFVATPKRKENADFSFENQKASYQWLSFPENQVVEVTMGVSVASGMEGYFVIKGITNWISNNEPHRMEIYPQVITVKNTEKSDEDFKKSMAAANNSYDEFNSNDITCIRQVPYEENGEVIVNIMVNKGNLNKYGKIQETIPYGYKVENIKSYNAIFVFNETQNTVKYMWMAMPEKSRFLVSYKLIPTEKVDKSNPFLISGTFYYAVNNKTLTIDILERGIEFTNE
jgi:hypothetical protein